MAGCGGGGSGYAGSAIPVGLASWRPYTTPPVFTGTNLNAPTTSSVTQPYPMRLLTVTYTGGVDDRLFYQELSTISGASWSVRVRARGISMGVGFAGYGVGVRFSNGIYCSANIIRNNAIGDYVVGIARYNAVGVQQDTRNQNGTAGDAWALGRWFLLSWDANTNISGEGLGELSLTTGLDGYNYDPVIIRLGNLNALGVSTSGVGAGLAPFTPITVNYQLQMGIESFAQL